MKHDKKYFDFKKILTTCFALSLFIVGAICNKENVYAQFQIEIVEENGENFYIEIKPTDRVEDLRVKIEQEKGISTNKQILTFVGNTLEDGDTLQDYSIQKDNQVYLTIKKEITLDLANGKIKISPTGYSQNNGEEIAFVGVYTITGTIIDDSVLTLENNSGKDVNYDVVFDNAHILGAFQCTAITFNNNSNITVNITNKGKTEVRAWYAPTFKLLDSSTGKVHINIDEKEGSSLYIGLRDNYPQTRETLIYSKDIDFKINGETVNNTKPYKSGQYASSEMETQPESKQIFVKCLDKHITLEVESHYTIRDIKFAIKDKEGYDVDKQELVYINQKLLDYKTLDDYNIAKDTTLHLYLKEDIETVEALITTPKGGEELNTNISSSTTGVGNISLKWTDTVNNDKSGIGEYYPWCYKAHITISPAVGYAFNQKTRIVVNGVDINNEKTLNADGSITVTNDYYSTKHKLTSVVVPTLPTEFNNFYNSDNVANNSELPKTVEAIIDGEKTSLGIVWSVNNYDASKGETNTFYWKLNIDKSEYEIAEACIIQGTLDIKNKVSIPETITDYDQTIKYAGSSDRAITCEEYMNSKNWTWSVSKNTCVYKVSNTSAKLN